MQKILSNDEVFEAFHQATETFLQLAHKFTDQSAGIPPAPGKWSGLEIMEHVIITDRSAYLAMLKAGEVPSAESLAEKEARFTRMAEADNIQILAPEAAQPKGKFKTVTEALEAFVSTREKLMHFARENDLSLLAAGFEHPRLGMLTRQQWVRFSTWHVLHHSKQMQRILGVV